MSIKYKALAMFIFPMIFISWLEIDKHRNNLLGEFPSFYEAFQAGFLNYLYIPLVCFIVFGGRNKNLQERGYLMIAMLLLLHAPAIIVTVLYGNYKYLSFQAGEIFSIFIGFFIIKLIFKYIIGTPYATEEKTLNSLDEESIEFVKANGMKICMGHYFEHNPKENPEAIAKSIFLIKKTVGPIINSILKKERISLKEIKDPAFIHSLSELSHILREERRLREEDKIVYPKLKEDEEKIPSLILTQARHRLSNAQMAFQDKLKHLEYHRSKHVKFSST